ncbi:Alkaline ceramidase TOD1 [Cardamine amara subsp. amara]|uniref:Alkaline ceramidase TOD1 n=1 Tax=Cardamine amara subsp. amara TaxID=228776 RepID=A0ABD0ZQ33_CARAN
MGKFITTTFSPPLYVRSKLLCFSLLYLFTTIFLFLYVSLSRNQCVFRYSPFDPIQTKLFSYPSSYGEHKYALPTHRSSCSSPLLFSDYWTVLNDIQSILSDSSSQENLRYINGKSESFGGNFSTQKRFSYFNHSNIDVEVPCGFFRDFPISKSDRVEMKKCGLVVASAIFNDHDKIRQPVGLGVKTLETVCFYMFIDDKTINSLFYHNVIPKNNPKDYRVGAWRIIKISKSENLYLNPAMNGVIPKYLIHRLFPNSEFSIWIDAKIQLMIDPLLLIHSMLVVPEADIAISKHPFFVNTMEEAMATARWKKWGDVNGLRLQMETYCEHGLKPWSSHKLPYPTDVPDSALILRRHGLRSNLFSCFMFNELEAFNPRDQLAFAFVRDHINPMVKMNMFEVEVFEQVVVEYRHNLKKIETTSYEKQEEEQKQETLRTIQKKRRRWLDHESWSLKSSSCKSYLMDMWS